MKGPVLLFIALMFWTSYLQAELDYAITPDALQRQVKLRSLAEVHDEIFSHPYAVNMLLLAIDSAEPDWLDVAELFLTEQNPISGPRLIMAIGEGLQWQPANVLQRGIPLERICSLEGLYEWRRFSQFLSDTSLQRRLAALASLAKTNERAEKCQQLLLVAQENVALTMDDKLPKHQH